MQSQLRAQGKSVNNYLLFWIKIRGFGPKKIRHIFSEKEKSAI